MDSGKRKGIWTLSFPWINHYIWVCCKNYGTYILILDISHGSLNEIYFIEMILSLFSSSCHLFWCLVARAYAFPKACLLWMYFIKKPVSHWIAILIWMSQILEHCFLTCNLFSCGVEMGRDTQTRISRVCYCQCRKLFIFLVQWEGLQSLFFKSTYFGVPYSLCHVTCFSTFSA